MEDKCPENSRQIGSIKFNLRTRSCSQLNLLRYKARGQASQAGGNWPASEPLARLAMSPAPAMLLNHRKQTRISPHRNSISYQSRTCPKTYPTASGTELIQIGNYRFEQTESIVKH